MKKFYPVVIMAIVVMCAPMLCAAADVREEDTTPRTKKIYLDNETQKSFLEKGKLKNIVGVSVGYDDNTHLDSQRDGDAFMQTYFKTTFNSPVNKKLKGILTYELMNLMYASESDLDVISNGLYGGVDYKINKNMSLMAGYALDWVAYFQSNDNDYINNRLPVELRQKLPRNMYHSLNYELSYKNYLDWHTRTGAAAYSDKKRNDWRNTVAYEVGKYLPKDLLRLKFEYFCNNSNERYLKYYDYDSYKIGVSATHLFSDKVFGYLSFYRQYRDFRSRTLSVDGNFKEWDRTYVGTSSLYYNVNKSFTLGLNYTYRQNVSNEPIENYSGSIMSLASYYRF
jgi:hypothetical protein